MTAGAVCGGVMGAFTKRAGRGRLGSLVASTDRRTVLSTVLGGIAFAAATQVPSVLFANVSSELEPLLQVALSVVRVRGLGGRDHRITRHT